jgi:hypothetical protein
MNGKGVIINIKDMADVSSIQQLKAKQLLGTLTAEEKEVLDALVNSSPGNEQSIYTQMQEEAIKKIIISVFEIDWGAQHEKILAGIRDLTPEKQQFTDPKRHRRILWRSLAAVAAILILFIGRNFYHPAPKNGSSTWSIHQASFLADLQQEVTTALMIFPKDFVLPKNYLLSQDFTQKKSYVLQLDSLPEGEQILLGTWAIIKESERHIAFKKVDKSADYTIKDSAYTRISIPKDTVGWQISLPDGSRAVLAPRSSLAIFLHSSGTTIGQRIVLLEGQATFEVHPDSTVPFLVETNHLKMTAHGTLFTISDFNHENKASVSLFNGKLDVDNGKVTKRLKPAQKASIGPSSADIQVDTLSNVLERLPWKPDYFDFSRQTLPAAMKKLAAWYGISNVFLGPGVDTTTPGSLSDGHLRKDLSLFEIVKILNRDDLHFYPGNKTLTVTK